MITDLATPSLTFLIESIYKDLRIHKIKKNAIEAKVREMGEKSKDKKVWVVRQAVQVSSMLSCDTADDLNRFHRLRTSSPEFYICIMILYTIPVSRYYHIPPTLR